MYLPASIVWSNYLYVNKSRIVEGVGKLVPSTFPDSAVHADSIGARRHRRTESRFTSGESLRAEREYGSRADASAVGTGISARAFK